MTVLAVARDSFNRADSGTLGTADSGQTYSNPSASSLGIASNQVKMVVAGGSQIIAVIDSGRANCTVRIAKPVAGDSGPCWRETDNNNYWVWNGASMFKRVAGTFTQVGSTQTADANGDTLAVILNGSSITFTRNGTTLISASDAHNSTATSHGPRINNDTTTRLDDLSVEVVAVPSRTLFRAVQQAANY